MNYRNRFNQSFSTLRKVQFHCRTRIQRLVLCILVLLGGVWGLYLAVGPLFYINQTESAPPGVYMVVPGKDSLTYGDYAVVQLSTAVPALHVPAGYLLIKKVQGLPGDTFTVTPQTVAANGRIYPYFDKPGLPHELSPGKHIVPAGKILFLNDPPISFDSRYLGPIPQTLVIRKIIPILEFRTIEAMYQRLRLFF